MGEGELEELKKISSKEYLSESLKEKIPRTWQDLIFYVSSLIGSYLGIPVIFSSFGVKIPLNLNSLITVLFLGLVYLAPTIWIIVKVKDFLDREMNATWLSRLYNLHNVLYAILSILLFSILIIIIVDLFGLTNFMYLRLCLGILLLILPFPAFISPILSQEGKIKLEFKLLEIYFKDFQKQQKWLTRIFKRIESVLRTGYINLSYSTLFYHFNIANKRSLEEIEGVKNALINKQYGTIISNLKTLDPEIKFTAFQRKPMIPLIRDFIGNNQKLIGFFVLLIIFILDPKTTLEYLQELFSFLS